MSHLFTFQIFSLIFVSGMKGLNPDLVELITLIQDYDSCGKRSLCPLTSLARREMMVVLT